MEAIPTEKQAYLVGIYFACFIRKRLEVLKIEDLLKNFDSHTHQFWEKWFNENWYGENFFQFSPYANIEQAIVLPKFFFNVLYS